MIVLLSALLFAPMIESRETFLDGKAIADVYAETIKKPDGSSHNLIVLSEPNLGDMTREDFLLLVPEIIEKCLSLGMEKLPVYLVRDGVEKKEFIRTIISKSGKIQESSSVEVDIGSTKLEGFPVKKQQEASSNGTAIPIR